jgi:hypothetical protein
MTLHSADDRITLAVSDHIRFCNVHGRVIILDLCDGEYLIFDEAATFLWDVICSTPPLEHAITAFAHKFGISPIQAGHDLKTFVDDCISRRLITRAEPTIRECTGESLRKPMTILNAWLCLRRTRNSLRERGFAKTYWEHMNLKFGGTHLSCDIDAKLRDCLQRFRYAENGFCVRNADIDCLPRSLALHRYLLAGGVKVDHCIGVRRFPFGAHAWVRVNGRPFDDSPSFVEEFTVIATIPACTAS